MKGLLYLQGESNNSAEAAVAGARLGQLISNVAAHVESLHPGSTTGLRTVVGEIAASQSNADRQLTTTQQMDLAAGNDQIGFVPTRDLMLKSDGIHFGRDAKLDIGYRFSVALLDMDGLPNGVAGDVNQDGVLSGDGTGLPDVDDISAFLVGWRADTRLFSSLNKVRRGDMDVSGRTDLADAFIMHEALSAQGASFPFSRLVPEPSTMGGLWCGLTMVLFLRRPFREQPR